MSSNVEHIDLIDAYMMGRLSVEEAQKVDERIENDKEFAELFEDIRTIRRVLQDDHNEVAVGRFSQLDKELGEVNLNANTSSFENAFASIEQNKLPKRRKALWPKFLGIAASIALLVAVGFIIQNRVQHKKIMALTNEYFVPMKASTSMRSGGDQTIDPNADAAYSLYQGGYYKEAAKKLEVLYARDSVAHDLLLAGVSYIAIGETG